MVFRLAVEGALFNCSLNVFAALRFQRVANGSGEPEGNGAAATRSRFLYRGRV